MAGHAGIAAVARLIQLLFREAREVRRIIAVLIVLAVVEQIDAVVRRNFVVILPISEARCALLLKLLIERHTLVAEVGRIMILDCRVGVDIAMVAFTVRVQAAVLAVRALLFAGVSNPLDVRVHFCGPLAIIPAIFL